MLRHGRKEFPSLEIRVPSPLCLSGREVNFRRPIGRIEKRNRNFRRKVSKLQRDWLKRASGKASRISTLLLSLLGVAASSFFSDRRRRPSLNPFSREKRTFEKRERYNALASAFRKKNLSVQKKKVLSRGSRDGFKITAFGNRIRASICCKKANRFSDSIERFASKELSVP